MAPNENVFLNLLKRNSISTGVPLLHPNEVRDPIVVGPLVFCVKKAARLLTAIPVIGHASQHLFPI
jgi:hypothetical protein